jgi:hypothetical protein
MLWRGTRWSIFGLTRDDLRWRLNHTEAAVLGTENSGAPRPCHTSSPDPRLLHARATKPWVFSVVRDQDSAGNSPRGTTRCGVTERQHAMAAPLLQASSMMPRFSKAHPMTRSSQTESPSFPQAHHGVLLAWAALIRLSNENSKLRFVLQERSKLMATTQLFIRFLALNHRWCRDLTTLSLNGIKHVRFLKKI